VRVGYIVATSPSRGYLIGRWNTAASMTMGIVEGGIVVVTVGMAEGLAMGMDEEAGGDDTDPIDHHG
jgi:hypothetical protein